MDSSLRQSCRTYLPAPLPRCPPDIASPLLSGEAGELKIPSTLKNLFSSTLITIKAELMGGFGLTHLRCKGTTFC